MRAKAGLRAGHYEIFHGYATLMTNNSHTSFVYNLISNVRERVPEWGLNPYQQWIHNVVYNYRAGAVIATRGDGDTPDVLNTSDFRRNTYKKGPWSNTDKDIRFRNTSGTCGMRCLTYLEGNVSSFVTDPSDLEQQKLMARVLSPNPETTPPDPRDVSEWVVSTSIGTPEIRMMTADESYVYVLDHAGNSRVRDSLDAFAVSTVVDDNGLTKMYSTVAEADIAQGRWSPG